MNPILVEITRGGVLESFHRGVICIVDRDENILYREGDIHQICFPRSALKFFQQLPLLLSGADETFGFTEQEIAIMCGSHNGEPAHVVMVDSILGKIGLGRDYLRCGAQFPSDRRSANVLIKAGEKPEGIHNNCSGKHAGFLAYAVFHGNNPDDYLNTDQPVQLAIKKIASEFHSIVENKMQAALDGCSAPIYALPVYNQALAYMRLVNPGFGDERLRNACNRVIDAARKYPLMIAGTGRYCTDLIRVCESELIGKTGAEGIYSLAFHREIIGACIKIDDGKMLPQYNVAQKIVKQSGLFSSESLSSLDHYLSDHILNFNKWDTGRIEVSETILPDVWR